MKRIILSLVSVTLFSYSMESDNSARVIDAIQKSKDRNEIVTLIENTRDPKVIRFLIESRAKDFGDQRANPSSSAGYWQAAFTAYAFNELKQGKRVFDILRVGKKVESTNEWQGMQLPFKVYAWDDAPLYPYFNQAINNWEELKKSMESDWELICAALESENEEK